MFLSHFPFVVVMQEEKEEEEEEEEEEELKPSRARSLTFFLEYYLFFGIS